ncbi:MAG: hypothetical protein ACT4QD_23905 [Acidobacteriota bacterium]
MPETAVASSNGQPAWVTQELPPQYADLANQIAALQAQAQQYEMLAAVLWQSGPSLTLALRDLFSALQLGVRLTETGASHDLCVLLDGGRRLLVEVVGTPDSVTRKSPQIAQALRALQEDAGEHDRVVIAANAFCDAPLASRKGEPVTADALRLIHGLRVNFVTTATLFGIWRYSLKDLSGAQKSVLNLYGHDGGVFR